jgi:hypothetical protein
MIASAEIAYYDDNPFIKACGPILSPLEITKRLLYLPPQPKTDAVTPKHIIRDLAEDVRRIHVPMAKGVEIAQTIGVMLRQGYVHRNPSSPKTWQRIYSELGDAAGTSPIQLGATVTGLGGVGKSTAVERALGLYPQVVKHASLPGLVGEHPQLLWLKVDVPGSGKVRDLVEALALACDDALGTKFTEAIFAGSRRSGVGAARQWLKMIAPYFLGVLVLDEIQNLFKIQTKAVRTRSRSESTQARQELRVVDDESLKLLLTITNFSKVPIFLCCTPDGLEVLSTRMSTSQRMVTGGYFELSNPSSADDDYFRKRFFPVLCRYQWLPVKLLPSDELRKLLFDLSGGILRICVTLWIKAHGRAIDRGGDQLDLDDLRKAAAQDLGPLQDAVQALHSADPRRLRRYEDWR